MNENQPTDVDDTELEHRHCEWNIQYIFSEYVMILRYSATCLINKYLILEFNNFLENGFLSTC